MKATMAALGADPERLEIPLLQFVHIVEGGSRASMSKRRGDFITLDELHRRDRRRRGALLHALALARLDGRPRPRPRAPAVGREPRLLRPVRARAHRLGAGARRGRSGWRARAGRHAAARSSCTRPSARWCSKLLAFPDEVAEAAERRAPHRIAAYALELAQVFTAFYRDCQVVGAEPAGARGLAPAAVGRDAADDRPRARPPRASRRPRRCDRRAVACNPAAPGESWGPMETLALTDDQVKMQLRQAVTAGIIWGWYRHLPLKGREWVVNPMAGPCVSYDRDGIRSFCAMLSAV